MCGGHQRFGLLLADPQLDHQAAQKLCFQFRIRGSGLPNGFGFVAVAVNLHHASVADENFAAPTGVAFYAGAEFVSLPSGVQAVQNPPQSVANEVHGQFGAVFRPVGFHNAQVLLVGSEQEAVFLPKLFDRIPHLFGRAVNHQPALVARTFNPHIAQGQGGGA